MDINNGSASTSTSSTMNNLLQKEKDGAESCGQMMLEKLKAAYDAELKRRGDELAELGKIREEASRHRMDAEYWRTKYELLQKENADLKREHAICKKVMRACTCPTAAHEGNFAMPKNGRDGDGGGSDDEDEEDDEDDDDEEEEDSDDENHDDGGEDGAEDSLKKESAEEVSDNGEEEEEFEEEQDGGQEELGTMNGNEEIDEHGREDEDNLEQIEEDGRDENEMERMDVPINVQSGGEAEIEIGNEENEEDQQMEEEEEEDENETEDEEETATREYEEESSSSAEGDDSSVDKVPAKMIRRALKKVKKEQCCPYECGHKSKFTSQLIVHIRAKHTGTKAFKCKRCVFKTRYRSVLCKHIKTKHPSVEVNKSPKMQPISCASCDYTTYSRVRLRVHRSSVHEPFKCGHVDCNSRNGFASQALLNHHISLMHKEMKPFKCDLCVFVATSKAEMMGHKRTKHAEESRPYKCTNCEYAAKMRATLEDHQRITHMGERPFKCSFCTAMYQKMSDLKLHEQRSHDKVRKHRFCCSDCFYSTPLKKALLTHKKKHSGMQVFEQGKWKAV